MVSVYDIDEVDSLLFVFGFKIVGSDTENIHGRKYLSVGNRGLLRDQSRMRGGVLFFPPLLLTLLIPTLLPVIFGRSQIGENFL